MDFTAHVAIGSAIGLAVGNPVAGFFVGWASHHFIDAIPHSDPGSFGDDGTNWLDSRKSVVWVLVDIIFGMAFLTVMILRSNINWVLIWSVIGATWPDVVDNSPLWSRRLRSVFPTKQLHWFHEKIHFTIRSGKYFWWGVATQILLIVVSIVLIMVKLT